MSIKNTTREFLYQIVDKAPFLQKAYNKIYERIGRRTEFLYKIIEKKGYRRIMEIGTFNGKNALQMIKTAKKKHGNNVEFYGFDLFEEMNPETYCEEIARKPISKKATRELLKETGCEINLFKGYTEETLPGNINQLPKMDFVYIDGGHSVETIQNDWYCTKKIISQDATVVFDDYWEDKTRGCKRVVENISRENYNVEILKIPDIVFLGQALKTNTIAKVTVKTS